MSEPLIVVAVACRPGAGSEAGKGWNWVRALSRRYEIHLVATPEDRDLCLAHPDGRHWHIHLPEFEIPTWEFPWGYLHYARWCRSILPVCQRLVREINPVGLCHVTLGSFRILPRYDRLGIPYVIGPVGGAEAAPAKTLSEFGLPPKRLLAELARPLANAACGLNPGTRAVFSGAALSIATTPETAARLRSFGAKGTAIQFPDVFEPEPFDAHAMRASQTVELGECFRLVWSGRILWWKGPHIAVRFLRALQAAGINARLDIYGAPIEADALAWLQAQTAMPGLNLHSPIPREELQKRYLQSHLFVYPTLHDSSSSAIPEAYATGLPSFTLGLGGTAVACHPDAGSNGLNGSIGQWISTGVDLVKGWIRSPERWLAASGTALRASRNFGLDSIERFIAQSLPQVWEAGSHTEPRQRPR